MIKNIFLKSESFSNEYKTQESVCLNNNVFFFLAVCKIMVHLKIVASLTAYRNYTNVPFMIKGNH